MIMLEIRSFIHSIVILLLLFFIFSPTFVFTEEKCSKIVPSKNDKRGDSVFKDKWVQLTEKKILLDQYRPLPKEVVDNLYQWFRVELTYTSNAIEGNTLNRIETKLAIEEDIAATPNKLISEYLEAKNHARAFDWIKKRAKDKNPDISKEDILDVHRIILRSINDEDAGYYRNTRARISGSSVILPNPVKIPKLMNTFVEWLNTEARNLHPIERAAEAHYTLVSIHPFVDGNGRTARLFMNMILLMEGYPEVIIRTEDRLNYITALEKIYLVGSKEDYLKLIIERAKDSLDIYLDALRNED